MMKISRKFGMLFLLLMIGVLVVGCVAPVAPAEPAAEEAAAPEEAAAAADEELIPIDFRLNWTLYGEHAPFFVGVDKGFYAEEGLDVTVNEGNGSATTVKLVGSGSNDIGYADSAAVMNGVAAGVPVKTVAVLLQTSPMSFIFKADKPIKTIDELKGKAIAITAGDASIPILSALKAKNGLTDDDIQTVVVANPAAKEAAVLEDKADAFMGYYIDQPMRMEDATGIDMDWTTTADMGDATTISSGIIVNHDFIAENPETVEAFVRATQKAVQYTIDNPEEAAEIFATHADAFDAELSLREINGALALLHTANSEGQPIGWSAEEDWQATQDLLEEYTGLAAQEDLSNYYTNQFVEGE